MITWCASVRPTPPLSKSPRLETRTAAVTLKVQPKEKLGSAKVLKLVNSFAACASALPVVAMVTNRPVSLVENPILVVVRAPLTEPAAEMYCTPFLPVPSSST